MGMPVQIHEISIVTLTGCSEHCYVNMSLLRALSLVGSPHDSRGVVCITLW